MKKLITSTLPVLVILINSSGCGGSSENTQEPPEVIADNSTVATVQESKEPSTQDLVAEPDFDFRTDMQVEVTVSGLKSETGKIVFYHGVGFYDEMTNIFYPAYENRLASMFALNDTSQSMQVDGNWEYLTVEWLPMDASMSEVYKVIKLTGDKSYILSFD